MTFSRVMTLLGLPLVFILEMTFLSPNILGNLAAYAFSFFDQDVMGVIVVVKKTFRYSNVFFYNHLCRNSVIRNIIMESGIIHGLDVLSSSSDCFTISGSFRR